MMTHALAGLFGLMVGISFVGWGKALGFALGLKTNADWARQAVWGIAWAFAAGGVLNVYKLISPLSIGGLILAGLVLFAVLSLGQSRFRWDPNVLSHSMDARRLLLAGVLGVLLLLCLFEYAGWISAYLFNPHDDSHAYLVFAEKMVQTGGLGDDPYSMRRLLTSLGSQHFLHAMVLPFFSYEHLYMLDLGLAVLLGVGLIYGMARRNGASPLFALVASFFFVWVWPPIEMPVNLTSAVIPVLLWVELYNALRDGSDGSHPLRGRIVLQALLASALISLKLTYLPAVLVLYLAVLLWRLAAGPQRVRTAIEVCLIACGTLLLLLPWMINHLHSSGTLLYPLFGRGYEGSQYGSFASPWADLTWQNALHAALKNLVRNTYLVPLVIATFCYVRWKDKQNVSAGPLAVLFGSVSAFLGLLLMIAIPAYGVRYAAPILFGAFMALAVRRFTSLRLLALLFAVGLIFASGDSNLFSRLTRCSKNIAQAAKTPVYAPSAEELASYRGLQAAVPPGAVLLARLSLPMLLDFNRNTVYVIDWPGGASPAPGLPSFKGGEALAEYLRSKSIRYVAYSYGNEANFQKERWKIRLESDNIWVVTQARHAFDFQDNLMELGSTRRRIYDDGKHFVLDLNERI